MVFGKNRERNLDTTASFIRENDLNKPVFKDEIQTMIYCKRSGNVSIHLKD